MYLIIVSLGLLFVFVELAFFFFAFHCKNVWISGLCHLKLPVNFLSVFLCAYAVAQPSKLSALLVPVRSSNTYNSGAVRSGPRAAEPAPAVQSDLCYHPKPSWSALFVKELVRHSHTCGETCLPKKGCKTEGSWAPGRGDGKEPQDCTSFSVNGRNSHRTVNSSQILALAF